VEIASTKLTQRIREEFEEAPGLRVTLREAARFWGLDESTCARVLMHLWAAGFLARGSDSRYRQASDG
jgi:DNA-binding IclR family transcriptional regulator